VIKRKQKNERVKWGSNKSPLTVKDSGSFIQGMDEQCADTRNIRCLERPQQGITQHARADVLSCITPINRQAGENHDRNGLRHVALNSAGRELVFKTPNGERIVPDNLIACADDIGTGCAGGFIFYRPLAQPVIQRRFSAEKIGNIVRCG
jgi:hypothetical protein